MIGRTNGGGGLEKSSIIINAPTGSLITFKQGEKIIQPLEEKGVWKIRNIELGSWTVTAQLNGQTETISGYNDKLDVYYYTIYYYISSITITTNPLVTCRVTDGPTSVIATQQADEEGKCTFYFYNQYSNMILTLTDRSSGLSATKTVKKLNNKEHLNIEAYVYYEILNRDKVNNKNLNFIINMDTNGSRVGFQKEGFILVRYTNLVIQGLLTQSYNYYGQRYYSYIPRELLDNYNYIEINIDYIKEGEEGISPIVYGGEYSYTYSIDDGSKYGKSGWYTYKRNPDSQPNSSRYEFEPVPNMKFPIVKGSYGTLRIHTNFYSSDSVIVKRIWLHN